RVRVREGGWALLGAFERGLRAGDDAADAASAFGENAGARIARGAIERNDEGSLVVGWFERDRSRLAGPSAACRRPDCAGHVAQAVKPAGTRPRRRLPAPDLAG